MAKHIVNKIVRFAEFTDLEGNPVHDWHDEYLDMVGMLSIYESENTSPGDRFVYFYPNEPNMDTQRFFQTLTGEISESEDRIVLEAENKYFFEIGDYVSEDDKALLWLNVFLR